MKQVHGYYNEQRYYVTVDNERVYEAGNSPYESQAYVSAKDGVGIKRMRQFCISTAHDIAKEQKAHYAGVERILSDDYQEGGIQ